MEQETDALIVKPRTRKPQQYNLIAVDTLHNQVLTEDGQALTVTELVTELPTWKPTLIVTLASSAEFAAILDEHYRPRFDNWRVHWGTDQHERIGLDGRLHNERQARPVYKLGWVMTRSQSRKTEKRTGYMHLCIDTITCCGDAIWEYVPMRTPAVYAALQFGRELRDWCNQAGWEVRATKGAIAAQAFTDPRFYPNARRKVPAVINRTAREHMPGNHLRLLVEPNGQSYTAWYLDQQSAHHWHAQNIGLPTSNSLWAFGNFITRRAVYKDHVASEFYGLHCLDLEHHGRWHPFDWMPQERTLTAQYVWTSELEHLIAMGWRISGVRASWGSTKRDVGLSRFAAWAQTQRDTFPEYKWLKPLLLATYGAVAGRPRYFERYYNVARKGDVEEIVIGACRVTVKHVKGKIRLEPRFTNVLHRGLIEASMRSETVMMAQELNRQGCKVLQLYADGVIVEDDGEPTFPLFAPWRLYKQNGGLLTHYEPVDDVSIQSDQIQKLPGRPRRGRFVRVKTPSYARQYH